MMKAQDIGISLCCHSVHFCFTSMKGLPEVENIVTLFNVLNVLLFPFKDAQKTLAPACGVEE